MENKRPRLDDPNEYAIIKAMYFDDHRPFNDDIDPIEKLERQEAKYKYNQQSSQ